MTYEAYTFGGFVTASLNGPASIITSPPVPRCKLASHIQQRKDHAVVLLVDIVQFQSLASASSI